MGYNTKRYKILSIKLIYIVIAAFLLIKCQRKPPLPTKIELVKPIVASLDSIVRWKINEGKYDDSIINNSYTINQVKQKFKLIEGKLYDVQAKEVVSNVVIVLYLSNFNSIVEADMYSGLPKGFFCDASNGVTCKKMYNHDNVGNIDGVFVSSEYEIPFKKGNGVWKDYYADEKNLLKEEGEVKKNFKYGEWKYYNQEGKIDSIKTYALKDSVDVRFPHCIFNKAEPCY